MKLEDEIKQDKFKSQLQKALLNIVVTNNWMNYSRSKILKKYGITLPQYNVLRILRGKHPESASVNDIRSRMLDKVSDASRLVDKLKLKSLVNKTENQLDRRNMDVTISQAGLDLLKIMDLDIENLELEMENITNEEAIELNRILDKLRG